MTGVADKAFLSHFYWNDRWFKLGQAAVRACNKVQYSKYMASEMPLGF
jgi:hypothetical protein